ncbi:MAG TPA: exo-alpha-sialidase [Cyclobacteriaceae bacterium]|nr:exo-alpha-sialidase [Cyclobacteriaceae bacterium]
MFRTKILILYILSSLIGLELLGQTVAKDQVVLQEMLLFPMQEQHVHGSSIVSLPNGDFLTAWFQGSGERTADDVKIMGSRLAKGAKGWSEPFELADTPHLPDCNPVLFLNDEGKLFLVWIAVQANRWEHSVLRFRTSSNYQGPGAPVWDWQDNILLKPGDQFAQEVAAKLADLPRLTAGWAEYAPDYDKMIIAASEDPTKRSTGWMTRIKPLILESGKILLPLYSDGFNLSIVAVSEDQGRSWLPSLPIVGRGPIQPALAQKKNGEIVALMRDSGDAPARVQKSISKDEGQSWSAAVKTDIPNTASVELLVLQSGHWAFLGNDIDDGRYRVALYLSDDEGESWQWQVYLEDEPKGSGGFSYPSLIQTDDGFLHLTYSFHLNKEGKTIKYITLDPERVFNSKKP